ncbi:MAG: hypothetical protein ACRD3O_13260, partial [Terriglobia bacterium]
AGGVGVLATPAAPLVVAVPGAGTLPAGTYYVEVTAVTAQEGTNGETLPSAAAGPLYLVSPGSLVVTFPPLPNADVLNLTPQNSGCTSNSRGCAPFNVYIGRTRSSETLQNTGGTVGGAIYRQATPLLTYTPHPPTVNTAGYTLHDVRLSKSGAVARVVESINNTQFFWFPGTTKVSPCVQNVPTSQLAGYCGGHGALGYSHVVNGTGFFDDMGIVIHPLSNLFDWTLLVSPVATPQEWTEDTHWSWSDANPPDTMPVCGASYVDALVSGGDGTQNVLTNPLLRITREWDREIVCVAASGPSTVWRFAHDRATGALNDNAAVNSNFWSEPIGNVSQDGKFYLFGTDWEWSLGSQQGSYGCPSAGICRTDVFIVQLH